MAASKKQFTNTSISPASHQHSTAPHKPTPYSSSLTSPNTKLPAHPKQQHSSLQPSRAQADTHHLQGSTITPCTPSITSCTPLPCINHQGSKLPPSFHTHNHHHQHLHPPKQGKQGYLTTPLPCLLYAMQHSTPYILHQHFHSTSSMAQQPFNQAQVRASPNSHHTASPSSTSHPNHNSHIRCHITTTSINTSSPNCSLHSHLLLTFPAAFPSPSKHPSP